MVLLVGVIKLIINLIQIDSLVHFMRLIYETDLKLIFNITLYGTSMGSISFICCGVEHFVGAVVRIVRK